MVGPAGRSGHPTRTATCRSFPPFIWTNPVLQPLPAPAPPWALVPAAVPGACPGDPCLPLGALAPPWHVPSLSPVTVLLGLSSLSAGSQGRVQGVPLRVLLGPSPLPLPRQAEQRILSQVHSLERRLEALAAEFSSSWQKEAIRLERLELRQGTTGQGGSSGLSHEDTLALLEGLVGRREAALKEDVRRDTATLLQVGSRAAQGGTRGRGRVGGGDPAG